LILPLLLSLLLSLLLLLLLVTDASSVSARVLLILPETANLLPLLLLLLLLPLLSSPALSPTAAIDELSLPGAGRDHPDAVSPIDANTSSQSCSSAL
jgi:hypothetical protein